MSRKSDLEEQIRDSYSIIRGYERQIQVSNRPEERLRARRSIGEQWDAIEVYLSEYRRIVGSALPSDIAEIAAHFGAPKSVSSTDGSDQPLAGRGESIGVTTTEATEIQHYYALLIGVSQYVHAAAYTALPHTLPDVVELGEVLQAAGYTVLTLHNAQTKQYLWPTRANILNAINNMAKQTGPGDLLLVYFGGHGDMDGTAPYLVPMDGGKAALDDTAINLAKFKQTLAEAGAQAKVLILDACHSGIGRSADGMDAEFDRLVHLQATGTATLAACRKGEKAYEHPPTRHGAFTYYLLQGLRGKAASRSERFVTVKELSSFVTGKVKAWAIEQGLDQWPNSDAKLVGDPPLIVLQKEE